VSVPAPDPTRVRGASLDQLRRLGLPQPPPRFPLVWELGDVVDLRPLDQLTARTAILNVVQSRCFRLSGEAAMAWLLEAHLLESLTKPEWAFVASGEGEDRSFELHLEAIYGLAWLIGLVAHLDPIMPAPRDLDDKLPDLESKETFEAWRVRTIPNARPAAEAAAVLDLLRCLDWAYVEAEERRIRLPGLIDSNAIAQRRWALEWAVLFSGPGRGDAAEWEEVDLST
jgi:hypothetical protein